MTDTTHAPPLSGSLLEKNRRAFLWRKLFSLTGVVPVGAYTVFHLWENSAALRGREAYNEMVERIGSMPYLTVLEVGLIIVPILFHAVLGLKYVLDASYNVFAYRYSRNLMFALQRITGVLALGFIVYHLYELRWQKLLGVMPADGFYDALCRNMSTTVGGVPVLAIVYLIGIASVSFHLANGLWGFLFSWGITVTRRSQRLAATVLGFVGLLVFIMGANTTLYFATGARMFLPSEFGAPATSEPPHCPEGVLHTAAPAALPAVPAVGSSPANPANP